MTDADWHWIRSTRANPPRLAGQTPARRRDYVAALTQFEQLFAAASEVGAASQPILLFYGLSQAGRALLAATKSGDWRAHGHGVRFVAPTDDDILQTIIRPSDRPGLLQAVASALGSPTPTEGFELGAAWNALPDVAPVESVRWPQSLNIHESTWPLQFATIQTEFGPAPAEQLEMQMPWGTKTVEEAASLLANYPLLRGARVERGPIMTSSGPQPLTVALRWVKDGGVPVKVLPGDVGAEYPGRGHFVLPAIGGTVPTNLLMVWWLALYSMSMLARYEPSLWVAALNVDESPVAVPVEAALGRALEVVPALVVSRLRAARTIDALSDVLSSES